MTPLRGRDYALAALLALAAAALYAVLGVHAGYTGTISDAAVYLVIADHFSPWRTTVPDLGPFAFARYPFPPLYPLLLAWAGGGSSAPFASHAFGAATLGAAVGAAYAWLRANGAPAIAALALTLLFALLPVTLVTALDIVSEPLYLLLSLVGLVAIAGPATARRGLVAALAIGLAAVARTAGVTLLAAFVLAWLPRARGTLRLWPPLLACAPAVVWSIVKHVYGLGTYDVDAGGPARLIATMGGNLRALAEGLVTSFDLTAPSHVALSLAGLAVPAAIGWFGALRRRECAAWYAAFHLALLLVWPHPAHARRFLFVLLPFALGYVWSGAVRLAGERGTWGGTAVVVLVGLLGLPGGSLVLGQIASGEPERRTPMWYRIADPAAATRAVQTTTRMLRFVHAAGSSLPADACISAALPQYVLLHAHRRTEILPLPAAGAQALDAALARCPYVMMMAVEDHPPSGLPPMYPFAWIKNRMKVLGVEYLHPGSGEGTVLAMLARVERVAAGD
ncbi:MAG: hypothetical protein HY749_00780 [Gammaproteobacteria bacterium]|nr:hypothetical protein [Gammaproteobacteria bacterium]